MEKTEIQDTERDTGDRNVDGRVRKRYRTEKRYRVRSDLEERKIWQRKKSRETGHRVRHKGRVSQKEKMRNKESYVAGISWGNIRIPAGEL